MKFAQTICSAVPLTRISISNLELLKKIATARKLQITEEVLNKLTTTQEQIKINENTIFFDKISSLSYIEFGNLHLDLSKIEKLTELQRNFHSIEEYPQNLYLNI
ncbi:hypothetical protein HHI36_002519 [Cryptolaemus montrouzieri]|uniref:Uncharacterized protein n=1 Tax=Cryptolaemus montrouzieri TaxID=559131 RepID=A0ABD2PBD8_9CUCU